MKTQSIGFIGGGRITNIFLQGFQNKDMKFSSVKVCDINPDVLNQLQLSFPEAQITDSLEDVIKQEIIFIALHPPVIGQTIDQLKSKVNADSVIVSLAPKFTIAKIADLTGTKRVIRVIPNATSFINRGYNPVCFSDVFDVKEKGSIFDLLKVLGTTFEVEENKLEAYAICSAMLPTYFWFQWREMEKIAGEIGLSEKEGKEAIYKTLKASLEIMYESELSYTEMTDLIPIKPIGANEKDIQETFTDNLISLYNKIKPQHLVSH